MSDKNKTMITKIIMKGRNRGDQVVVQSYLEFEQGEVLVEEKGGRRTRQDVRQRQPATLSMKRITRRERKLLILKMAKTFTKLTTQPQ